MPHNTLKHNTLKHSTLKNSTLKPDGIIAFLDAPDTIKTILDSSIWAAQRLHDPITLLYSRPDAQAKQDSSKQLLKSATVYCNEHCCKEPIYSLHRHCSMSESLDYVDTSASLIITGRTLTCQSTLANFIRPSHRPILVTADTFITPSSALLAFDNKPTCHRLLDWVVEMPLLRGMTLHVVMVAEITNSNQDALREAYVKLTQAGYKCKKQLIHSRHVASALLYYQQEHKLDMLVSGAFGQSRLRQWLQGSDTEYLLQGSDTAYLLFPKA